MVFLNTLISTNQWNSFPIGNTVVIWCINLVLIVSVLWYKHLFFHPKNKKDYLIVTLYFIWMLAGVLRGMFVAEGYWEWKQWGSGSMALALPIFVYVFSLPWLLHNVLKYWLKFALPLFFIFFLWALTTKAYHFYLGPVLLLSCFLPVIASKKYVYIFLGLLLLMIFVDFGARSQVIKALIAILMSISFLLTKFFSTRILKFGYWFFIATPVILLYLGLTGQFNIFQDLSSHEGKYVQTTVKNGKVVQDDLSADTRTFIYVEVIESALKHDYLLWGRTPTRGNDSVMFGEFTAEELKTGKYERHANEVCFPNVFTWLGLVGLILYCFIYLKSSYLAIYKSRNRFMKLLGVYIAFRFAYGWVEDFNNLDIMSISLWMMIAMGFSEKFRMMSDVEFTIWVKSIFGKRKKQVPTLSN